MRVFDSLRSMCGGVTTSPTGAVSAHGGARMDSDVAAETEFERAKTSEKISDLEDVVLRFPSHARAADARALIATLAEHSWFLPVDGTPLLESWKDSGLEFRLFAPDGSLGSTYYRYVLEVKKEKHAHALLMVSLEASRAGSFLGLFKQKSHGNCGPFPLDCEVDRFKRRATELAHMNLPRS